MQEGIIESMEVIRCEVWINSKSKLNAMAVRDDNYKTINYNIKHLYVCNQTVQIEVENVISQLGRLKTISHMHPYGGRLIWEMRVLWVRRN